MQIKLCNADLNNTGSRKSFGYQDAGCIQLTHTSLTIFQYSKSLIDELNAGAACIHAYKKAQRVACVRTSRRQFV